MNLVHARSPFFFASDKVVFFDKYVLQVNKFSNDSLKVLELK